MSIVILVIHLHAAYTLNVVTLMAPHHALVCQLILALHQIAAQSVSSILSARAIKHALMKSVEILALDLADKMRDAMC
jgi:hypothetical protein